VEKYCILFKKNLIAFVLFCCVVLYIVALCFHLVHCCIVFVFILKKTSLVFKKNIAFHCRFLHLHYSSLFCYYIHIFPVYIPTLFYNFVYISGAQLC